MEVPAKQAFQNWVLIPTSTLISARACSLKDMSNTKMDESRCLLKESPQLLPHRMACVKKTGTTETNCPFLSLIITVFVLGAYLFPVFYSQNNLSKSAVVIQIWKMTIHCPCDLSDHHCCSCAAGGWRQLLSAAYGHNLSPACFLNKWWLLLSVEIGQTAKAATYPFSTQMCHWPAAASDCFSSFFEESVPSQVPPDEGSGVSPLQGKLLSWLSGLCHSHRNQPSCHSGAGV